MAVISWFISTLFIFSLSIWGYEAYTAITSETYRIISMGELWSKIDGNSLVGFQSIIEKHLTPWIWWNIIVPLLKSPSWAIPLTISLLILILRVIFRKKNNR